MLGAMAALAAPVARAANVSPQRPVHTFSIVARDSVTGEIGVAVQSHYFSVGSVVPWAEAGVGAVRFFYTDHSTITSGSLPAANVTAKRAPRRASSSRLAAKRARSRRS